MGNTLTGLKKYLKEHSLDENIEFTKFEDGKLYAKLDSGKEVYWFVNPDFTLGHTWYYTE